MPTNAQARARRFLFQPNDGRSRPSGYEDMPDWLRSQFYQTGGENWLEDGTHVQERWGGPGHIVRDSQGRRVVLLGDNRQLEGTNDLAMNPDYNPDQHAYFDPELGWVASGDFVNDQPWQRTRARNRGIATAVMGSMLGAGLFGAGGPLEGVFGAGGPGTEGLGLDSLESFTATNPGWEAGAGPGWEGLGAGDGMSAPEGFGGDGWSGGFGDGGLDPETLGGIDAGGGFPQSDIPGMNDLFPNGLPSEGTFADTGWLPETAPGGASGLGSRLAQWIAQNPGTAARLGLAGASLVSGSRGGGGGINTSSGISGGGTSTTSPISRDPGSGVGGGTGGGYGDDPLGDFARETFDRNRRRFLPLEDAIIDDAMAAGSAERQQERADTAMEDVAQQFDRERGRLRRNLGRGGVNAFGAAGQALEGKLQVSEGAARAMAANAARKEERDSAVAQRERAAGIAGQSVGRGITAAGQSGQLGLGRERIGLDRERAIADDEYRREALNRGIIADNRSNQRQNYRDIGTLISGAGRLFDGFDWGDWGFAEGGQVDAEDMQEPGLANLIDGGAVAGPGDAESDSIPAWLSDGEFVLPAETVKLVDKLSPGLLERLRRLGLDVRKMKKRMEQGDTLEGEFEVVGEGMQQ